MASRIILRNRVWYSTEHIPRVDWSRGMPTRRDGTPINCTQAIAPQSPESPFLAGVGVYDAEEDLAYRVVPPGVLNPLDGWASSSFWQERWKIDHKYVVGLSRLGFLDAAAAEGSQVRRYRCRDEKAVLRSTYFEKAYANTCMMRVREREKAAKS